LQPAPQQAAGLRRSTLRSSPQLLPPSSHRGLQAQTHRRSADGSACSHILSIFGSAEPRMNPGCSPVVQLHANTAGPRAGQVAGEAPPHLHRPILPQRRPCLGGNLNGFCLNHLVVKDPARKRNPATSSSTPTGPPPASASAFALPKPCTSSSRQLEAAPDANRVFVNATDGVAVWKRPCSSRRRPRRRRRSEQEEAASADIVRNGGKGREIEELIFLDESLFKIR